MSLQSGQRSRKSFGACQTCTHVFYQQISILTLNFNTSFVGYLTNVATLEYFTLTVFFSVFVERCSRVWLGASNDTRCWQFLTRPHVLLVTVCCSSGSRGNSRVLGIVAVWSTAVDICSTRGSEHLYIFVVSFLLCLVSVSVFRTTQRRLACPCASVDTHQSRSAVKFHVAQFQRCCVSFFLCSLSRKGICAFL